MGLGIVLLSVIRKVSCQDEMGRQRIRDIMTEVESQTLAKHWTLMPRRRVY